MRLAPTWRLPPTDVSIGPEQVHIWRISLAPAEPERYRATLSAEERDRADRFRADRHRRRFIVAHAALRLVLGRYLEWEPQRLVFESGPYGKPHLAFPSTSPAICFNLSHSADLALLSLAVEREVGIDLEHIRPVDSLRRLTERYFAPGEQHAILNAPPEEQVTLFFRCWTQKEAVLKAIGTGLVFPLDQICLALGADGSARLESIRGDQEEAQRWWLASFEPAVGYLAAVALRGPEPERFFWDWQP